MPSVVCLSGYPGVGKTTRRKTMGGVQFDIADIYDEYEDIQPMHAFGELMTRMIEALRVGEPLIVLEAMFARGSFQRATVETLCSIYGAECSYIELFEKDEVCIQRIILQYKESPRSPKDTRRFLARLRMFERVVQPGLLAQAAGIAEEPKN